MSEKKTPAEELSQKIINFFDGYYLIGVRKDRDEFYALSAEEIKKYPLTICGIVLNLIMDGKVDASEQLIESLDDNNFYKTALTLIHPKVTLKRFVEIIRYLKETNRSIHSIVLNAGRPYILNGFYDFTRLGIFLERYKDTFIEELKYLYEPLCCPYIYNLALAEYYYQQDRILDSQLLVCNTINEFDKASQSRLLFVALFLQSKILLTQGKIVDTRSYIKDIRNFVKKNGEKEFSYNIDAAETSAALYEGNLIFVTEWLNNKAPDEFANFNMLDLYRYMVKIRCYIINKKYAAVIALIEKLRPLLEAGRRNMDICELNLLLAICLYRSDQKPLAFESLQQALKTAKRYKYYRLIADEGVALLPLLIEYIKEKGESDFLLKILEITRNMAISHPLYLKAVYKNKATFSKMEINVLKLLEQGKHKNEIADYFIISENTVKYYLKKIYSKLDVSSAHQAVWEARISGII